MKLWSYEVMRLVKRHEVAKYHSIGQRPMDLEIRGNVVMKLWSYGVMRLVKRHEVAKYHSIGQRPMDLEIR
jgi:hypothetical protein